MAFRDALFNKCPRLIGAARTYERTYSPLERNPLFYESFRKANCEIPSIMPRVRHRHVFAIRLRNPGGQLQRTRADARFTSSRNEGEIKR